MSGYIPLRNEGRSQEEEAYFALSVGRVSSLPLIQPRGKGWMSADDYPLPEQRWER